MSTLFASKGLPSVLAHIQDTLTMDNVMDGLSALGYRKNTPGVNAIEEPVTPLDKAFQIYALHLMQANGYGHEPYDHTAMWARRDAAWSAAANWLLETQPAFRDLGKTETRKIAKLLPEAVRIQCSLELPPGSWAEFPRDGMKRGAEMNALTDMLQKMGLNIKVRHLTVASEEKPSGQRGAMPADYGTLNAMLVNLAVEQKTTIPPSTLDLF